MIKLLQNEIQVSNKSKLQLTAKFICYIYPGCQLIHEILMKIAGNTIHDSIH